MDLKDIADAVQKDGSNLFRSWYAVVAKGHKAFRTVDLKSEEAFYFALRFMLYMAAVAIILEVPVAASLGLKYDSTGYIVSTMALYAITWIVDSVIFHYSMRIFGGKVELRESVSVFCFLTAFVPLIEILQLPIRRFLFQLFFSNAQGPIPDPSFLSSFLSSLSPYELVVFLCLYVAQFLVGVYFLVVVYQSLRVIHRLTVFRGIAAFLTGIVGILVYVFIFEIPTGRIIESAFK